MGGVAKKAYIFAKMSTMQVYHISEKNSFCGMPGVSTTSEVYGVQKERVWVMWDQLDVCFCALVE